MIASTVAPTIIRATAIGRRRQVRIVRPRQKENAAPKPENDADSAVISR